MHTQKFDPTKPHGTIWGHADALYEQNGILFDGEGNPVEEVGTADQSEDHTEEYSREVTFLKNILKGGPVLQANIKRDSEMENLIWANILSAAAEIGVMKYKQGISNVWKLEAL